jgi:hypothetical protein
MSPSRLEALPACSATHPSSLMISASLTTCEPGMAENRTAMQYIHNEEHYKLRQSQTFYKSLLIISRYNASRSMATSFNYVYAREKWNIMSDGTFRDYRLSGNIYIARLKF